MALMLVLFGTAGCNEEVPKPEELKLQNKNAEISLSVIDIDKSKLVFNEITNKLSADFASTLRHGSSNDFIFHINTRKIDFAKSTTYSFVVRPEIVFENSSSHRFLELQRISESKKQIVNLIIRQSSHSELSAFYIVYEFQANSFDYFSIFSNYSGSIKYFSLDGDLLKEDFLENGKIIYNQSHARSKSFLCYNEYYTFGYTCVEGPTINHCSDFWVEYHLDPVSCDDELNTDIPVDFSPSLGGGGGDVIPISIIDDGSDGNQNFIEDLNPDFIPGELFDFFSLTKSKRIALFLNYVRFCTKNNIVININNIFSGLPSYGDPFRTFSGTIRLNDQVINVLEMQIGVTPNYRLSKAFVDGPIWVHDASQARFDWVVHRENQPSISLRSASIRVPQGQSDLIYNFVIGN